MKQTTLTQDLSGWHVSIQFEAAPKSYARPMLPMAGIDCRTKYLATMNDGTTIGHRRLTRELPSVSGG